jgi:methyl-accepting chemotaxis protein
MKRLTLKKRLLFGGLTAVIIPLVIVGIIAVRQSTNRLFENQVRSVVTIGESTAHTIDAYMKEQIVTARNISYSNSVIAAAEKVFQVGVEQSAGEIMAAQREVSKIKDAAGERFSSVTLVNRRTGHIFASSDDGKYAGLDLSSRAYLKVTFGGTPFAGAVVRSKATGKLVCTVAYPIYTADGSDITGAVVMAIWLDYLQNIIAAVQVGEGGYVYLTDEKGVYIAHPEESRILTLTLSDVDKTLEKVVAASTSSMANTVEYTAKGQKKFCAFSTVPTTGWKVFASFPMEELLAPGRNLSVLIVSVGIVALICASLFFYFFARNLSGAVNQVMHAAQLLAIGDTDIAFAEERDDELGKMLAAMKEMTKTMKGMATAADRGASGDLTVEIAPRSERDVLGKAFSLMMERTRKQIAGMQEAVNILSSSASEIMASVSQVSSSAAETSTSVNETTTTVEEVKQTAQLSSKKATQVSDMGRQTEETARSGIVSIHEALEGMKHIREQMTGIADTVIRLSEQSQSIGEITATVTGLTEQTNLLAVNASIEATKAGEQGRGFSVVAQEMKSLSDQSKQATVQIRNILNDIQRAISTAVMSTEQGNKAVDAGFALLEKSSEAIATLAKNVEEAANASVQIMASNQQQQVGMEQVASAMENIKEASAQMAAGTKQTERAIHDLHELGIKLKTMVEQYKV